MVEYVTRGLHFFRVRSLTSIPLPPTLAHSYILAPAVDIYQILSTSESLLGSVRDGLAGSPGGHGWRWHRSKASCALFAPFLRSRVPPANFKGVRWNKFPRLFTACSKCTFRPRWISWLWDYGSRSYTLPSSSAILMSPASSATRSAPTTHKYKMTQIFTKNPQKVSVFFREARGVGPGRVIALQEVVWRAQKLTISISNPPPPRPAQPGG